MLFLPYKILEGNIKIPPFQRNFVWKKEQVIDLLDSIIQGYPIGSILFWETKETLPAKRNIGSFLLPESEEDYPIKYVLDGQQRITSIFSVFCFDLKKESDENVNSDTFDIHFDISTEKFISNTKDFSGKSFPLKLLFDNFNFNKYIVNFSKEEVEIAVKVQSIFQNYDLPIVTIKKRDKSEVGIIFERINNTGTKLSILDLMTAWTWIEDFHLKEEFEKILEHLDQKNFSNITDKIILQCMSSIINKTTKTKNI